jgi:hypothetical protein
MKAGHPSFQFRIPAADGAHLDSAEAPMDAVAFGFEHLSKLVVESGLYISAMEHGDWSTRRGARSFQDIIVLKRIPRTIGFLDSANSEGASGWAALRNGSQDPVTISIHVNGEQVAQTPADRLRPDLVPHGYGTGHHGFHWVPAEPLPNSAEVAVYADGELIHPTGA